jgi:hypothetical protein
MLRMESGPIGWVYPRSGENGSSKYSPVRVNGCRLGCYHDWEYREAFYRTLVSLQLISMERDSLWLQNIYCHCGKWMCENIPHFSGLRSLVNHLQYIKYMTYFEFRDDYTIHFSFCLSIISYLQPMYNPVGIYDIDRFCIMK